jgi:virulence factor Mce-like protein
MSAFAAGLTAIGVIVVLTFLIGKKELPFTGHFTIHGVFRNVAGLRNNSFVRIAGVNVGKVTGIKHLTPDTAYVTMRVDDTGLPIHKDAQATIRTRIFLEGNFFVDVRPGSPSAPLMKNGDTIQLANTQAPIQLDQILSSLQSDTRTNLQVLLDEYARGLAGQGADGFNRSIQYWKGAYRDSAIVNQALLGSSPHDLSGFIKYAGKVAAAADQNPGNLESLVTDFNTTAAAFGANQSALEATIKELPNTLKAGVPALIDLDAAFPPLRGLISDLRPAVRSSLPALEAGIPFVHQLRLLVSGPELRGLVADLRPAVPSLAKLSVETVPLLKQVRLASSCQTNVVLPWTHMTIPDPTFPAKGQVFQEAPKPFPGLAGESRSMDANGQWFRVLLSNGDYTYKLGQTAAGSPIFAQSVEPLVGANPPKAPMPILRNDVPCETQTPPDLRTIAGQAPPQVKTSLSAPGALARYDKARAYAITWLEKQIKLDGLTRFLHVATQDITPAQIKQLLQQKLAIKAADLKRYGLLGWLKK